MDRGAVAIRVAETLYDTETAIDEALETAVRLLRRLMDARRTLGLTLAAGDPALRRVSATVNALGEAQREIVRVHEELDALRADLGLSGIAFGPLIKPRGETELQTPI